MSDIHEPSADYDSHVGNDIALYIFKDKELTYSNLIPYAEIEGGKEYVMRKTPETAGNLEFVAWAVPRTKEAASVPSYQVGDLFYDQFISHMVTRAGTHYDHLEYDVHLGTKSSVEAIDVPSTHMINMLYAPCRVEVRIRDVDNILQASTPGNDMHVLVHGVMSQMDLRKQGVGAQAVVSVPLLSCPSEEEEEGERFVTERFDVLPSANGQNVSVQVISNNRVAVTLTIPQGSLPKGAESGELLIFEHTLGYPYFLIIVADFTIKIAIVDGM